MKASSAPFQHYRFHHVLGHNLAFALIVSGILACWLERGRHWQAFALYVGLMHVHFGLDLVGSAREWGGALPTCGRSPVAGRGRDRNVMSEMSAPSFEEDGSPGVVTL
jgi:hypothetical protein